MNKLLKAKSWHLFLPLIITLIFAVFFSWNYPAAALIAQILFSLISTAWIWACGNTIIKVSGEKVSSKQKKMFHIKCLFIASFLICSAFLKYFRINMFSKATTAPMILQVLYALFFCYSFYSLLSTHFFNTLGLRNFEAEYEIEYQYVNTNPVPTYFFFVFFILGIWALQPRLNVLYKYSLKSSSILRIVH